MSSIDSWAEAVEAYDDMLDEVIEPMRFASFEFDASRVLREMDPIAYRVGLHDFIDSEGVDSDDFEDELNID